MTPAQATVEVFWTAYISLPEEERTSLIEKIMSEDELFEDYLDGKAIEERVGEPSISLEEYLDKRAKRKAA
ncbi:MAG TPA: hypothetical protein VEW28_07130 [Candidatus Kapabacteria bacterium]|nr:hypothetical protein [Candidatus Kapabacteria bacterium]